MVSGGIKIIIFAIMYSCANSYGYCQELYEEKYGEVRKIINDSLKDGTAPIEKIRAWVKANDNDMVAEVLGLSLFTASQYAAAMNKRSEEMKKMAQNVADWNAQVITLRNENEDLRRKLEKFKEK